MGIQCVKGFFRHFSAAMVVNSGESCGIDRRNYPCGKTICVTTGVVLRIGGLSEYSTRHFRYVWSNVVLFPVTFECESLLYVIAVCFVSLWSVDHRVAFFSFFFWAIILTRSSECTTWMTRDDNDDWSVCWSINWRSNLFHRETLETIMKTDSCDRGIWYISRQF